MTKMYKVTFNNHEVLIEAKKLNKQTIVQKKKITNKNKLEMNIIANDVLDCLNKSKELFFKQYNQYAKSIEVVRNANTSLNMINDNNMKVSA